MGFKKCKTESKDNATFSSLNLAFFFVHFPKKLSNCSPCASSPPGNVEAGSTSDHKKH